MSDVVQGADTAEVVVAEHRLFQASFACDAGVLRDAVQVLRGQHALGERRESDAARAQLFEHLEQTVLDVAVEQRVVRLVDE